MLAAGSPGSGVAMDNFRLNNLPSGVFYVPEFVTPEEEKCFLENIYNVSQARWTNLAHRRLQNWGGTPHDKGMVVEALPQWLTEICSRVVRLGLFGGKSANHVLVNEYLPGQGIMPHTDGPLYHPTVAIVSLSSGCLLDFYKPYKESFDHLDMASAFTAKASFSEERCLGSVYLQPRSLVIFSDNAYSECLHGIKSVIADIIDDKVVNSVMAGFKQGEEVPRMGPRISMTIRLVPKAIKASKIFGKTTH